LIADLAHSWGAEPLITVNENQLDPNVLMNQAEAYSLYVLSQLELQNASRGTLVFGTDVDERIRACMQEMNICPAQERLFVWETEPVARKQKSFNELKMLGAMILILLICGL